MSIAIICPTRGREKSFKRMCDSVKKTAYSDVAVFSATNGNDSYAPRRFPLDCPTVFMWNTMARDAYDRGYKMIMLGADDMYFATPGWDEGLMKLYDGTPHVYALQDSRDKDGTPHPIVTREWMDKMGSFLPPIFLRWYCDTWTVGLAKKLGKFTHLRDFLLVHDKPSDNGIIDNTHFRIRSMGWMERDKGVYEKSQRYFDLDEKVLSA